MTEKIRWWGLAPRNLFKITHQRAMAPPCEYEWWWEINALASFSSLTLSLLFIQIPFSEHTTPAVSLSDQANAAWGWLHINLIGLSVFPMLRCKEIRTICNAALDVKGQLVNQPVLLPLAFISIQNRETQVLPLETIGCSLQSHDNVYFIACSIKKCSGDTMPMSNHVFNIHA